MITTTKVVVQPPYRSGLSLSYSEAAARLAFFLTYFDTVVPLAWNPLGPFGQLMCFSTELEQAYVLGKHGHYIGPPMSRVEQVDDAFLDGMALFCLDNLQRQPGGGGFALASRDGFLPTTRLSPADRILLSLEDCLPCPHHDTPLEEILAFKAGHQAQLRAFHEAIDDLYFGFGARPIESLLPRLKDKLDAHVEAILKAYEYRQIKSYMGVLRIALKLAPGALGEAIGQLAGVPFVGGLVGGAIGLVADKSKLPSEGNAVPRDFEYVWSGLAAGHAKAFPHEAPVELDTCGFNMTRSVSTSSYPRAVSPPSRGDFSGLIMANNIM